MWQLSRLTAEAGAHMERQIGGQASVIAFGKIYILSGVLLVVSLPLLLLVRTTRAVAGGGVVHAE